MPNTKPLNEIVREQTGNVYEKYTDVGFAGVLLQAIIKELESQPEIAIMEPETSRREGAY